MTRRPMPAAARRIYSRAMSDARSAPDPESAWVHLERAHIISQPWAWPHTRNHAAMLSVALRQRDRREALGQLLRLVVAAPGSISGRYPQGNIGRATVGLTEPMPVPDDLAPALESG